ncbi:glutamate-rich protein 1 isoform X1 [Sciurus carolinensis]|uniref:glutamate-rich protein 1 isoform X1 n=1 Tax=Sciurus carolinensis TaxID=30640 RepID=UPI001FB2B69A|nr:glutamate-rich protein 1 isoform X1 [Sciurus carolinensis]
MSARRRHVFVEKVLKRLFPNVPSGEEKETPQIFPLEKPPRKTTSEKVKRKRIHLLTDGDVKRQSEQRRYTVSLPPEGYAPCLPEPSGCTDSDSASSGANAEGEILGDQDHHGQSKRRRIRKHKSKKNFKNPNNVHIELAESEKQQNLLQELQPQPTDGLIMSKNKKRKLKKKQQIRRKKAAGLVTKASGVSFMYQPEESSSEQEDLRHTAEGVQDSKEATSVEASGEDDAATTQEDIEINSRKAEGILNFLKSTQEIYFYDGVSRAVDSAISTESVKELLTCLESNSMPPSDVFILDHMRTLLLLHDTERLRRALEMLPEHCMMPPDHARVISAFFNYWITHIFPEKDIE